jgi:NAD+ diphosphatase
MVGFYAIGDPLEPIRIDLDNELEGSHTRVSVPNSPWLNLILDAKWFTREEVLAVLEHKEGTNFTSSDYKQIASIDERVNVGASVGDALGGDAAVQDGDSQIRSAAALAADGKDEPAFRVPPRTAIAGVLISDWAFGKVPAEIGFKGRM